MNRPDELQVFLEAAMAAYSAHIVDEDSRKLLRRICDALKAPAPVVLPEPARLPVCDCLAATLAAEPPSEEIRHLLRCFARLEPFLAWRRRTPVHRSASANFADGHGNVIVVGPAGLELRHDVWLGASLLAPGVRYPDHEHPPEEIYLVLSPGEFSHGESGWVEPGNGGTFYNPPGILHAMRSGDEPLFALWALWNPEE